MGTKIPISNLDWRNQEAGRRRYKAEFIRYLIFAQSSNDEAISQLNMINRLYFQNNPIDDLIDRYELLGRKINRFLQFVEEKWQINYQ